MTDTQAAPDNSLSPLKALEHIANRLLARDPETLAGLAELAGKVIQLELLNTNHPTISLLPDEHGIRLETDCPRAADTLIRGAPLALLGYAGLAQRRRAVGMSSDIEIKGDLGLAQRLLHVFQAFEIDREALLASWIGATLARKSNILFDIGGDLLRGLRDKIAPDLGEYITYEKELVADRAEVEEFNDSVEVLRDDLERLKKRLDRLNADAG